MRSGGKGDAIPIHTLFKMLRLLRRGVSLFERTAGHIDTAVTRGKRLVLMVGTRKALAIGIKNDKAQKRFTYLKYRLS